MADKKEQHNITKAEILSLYKERNRYYMLAYRYTRDSFAAEEIVSQSFIQLLQTKGSLCISDPVSFFSAMIKNRCINVLKSKKQEFELSNNHIHIERINTQIERLTEQCENMDVLADFPELITKCKEQLSDMAYNVFMAKRLEKMSYDEISKEFMISKRRINYEILKAQKIFRKEFKDYYTFAITIILSALMSVKSHALAHISDIAAKILE